MLLRRLGLEPDFAVTADVVGRLRRSRWTQAGRGRRELSIGSKLAHRDDVLVCRTMRPARAVLASADAPRP
jgi:hypothetical protein